MGQGLIEKILQQPDAPLLIQALNLQMEEERAKRSAFYEWVDEHTKAEFINGQVVLHSPVKHQHWKAIDLLSTLLSVYARTHQLGVVGTEKVMIALTRNDYEPDIVFFGDEKAAAFKADQVLFPAPDFVVEVLSSKTQKTDRTTKKEDYAAHGVQEYWIIDPVEQTVAQHLLLADTDKAYAEPHHYGPEATISSRAVTGFRIPVAAIFEDQANLAALQALMKK